MNKILVFYYIISISIATLVNAPIQFQKLRNSDNSAKTDRRVLTQKASLINYIPKSPGHYSKEDWRVVIDETWGPGLSTPEKLRIFDLVWYNIDKNYGGFVNFDVNIDSLRDSWRPEIENGVSKGRFAAIMTHFIQALNENHTSIHDYSVLNSIRLAPGVPIFVVGPCFMADSHFGASLTPLPDSSLVVLRAVSNHQLDINRGDIILGYDGIPWKNLYKEILDAQLPILNLCLGSTKESMTHILLSSAGLNWHLFDTIDIVKNNRTRDTVHIFTGPLRNQYLRGEVWGNEQIKIPGVPMPDYLDEDYISWGIVDGTKIGYIYIGSWNYDGYRGRQWGIGEKFYNAVDSLMFHNETTGLIIDFRCNPGGGPNPKWGGYSLLFNEHITKTVFFERGDPNNHYDMVLHSNPYYANPANFTIPGNSASFYDKPIAVLFGPGSNSAADWSSLKMKFHPMVRTFGKPSNGSFSTYNEVDLGNPDWHFQYANGSGILIDSPESYLIHTGAPVDEEVWFTYEDVAKGEDTVVKAAMAWINNSSTGNRETPGVANNDKVLLYNIFPNPFNKTTTIRFELSRPEIVTLKIFNIHGKLVKTLIEHSKLLSGNHNIIWDGTDSKGYRLTDGMLICRLCTDNYEEFLKMIIIK
ncbi:S41 family peptidase [Bacteroidota bacterium]